MRVRISIVIADKAILYLIAFPTPVARPSASGSMLTFSINPPAMSTPSTAIFSVWPSRPDAAATSSSSTFATNPMPMAIRPSRPEAASATFTSSFPVNPIPALPPAPAPPAPPTPPAPPAGFFSSFAVNIVPPPPPPANQDPEPYPYPQVYPEDPFPVSYFFF